MTENNSNLLLSFCRFANRFSKLNNFVICAYFLYMVTSYCSLLLQVNSVILYIDAAFSLNQMCVTFKWTFFLISFLASQLMAVGDYVNILRALLPTSGALFWFFLFCHFGNRITQRFDGIGDKLYMMAWYNLPLDQQKALPMIRATKNIYLNKKYLNKYFGIFWW